MRVHALVLLLVVGLTLPPATVSGAQTGPSADALWQAGQQLVRRGAYTQAQQYFGTLAEQLGPDQAPRALLLKARAALADSDTDAAEADLQQLLSSYPSSDQVAGAYLTLEQVRRAAADCSGALRALDAFEASPGHPYLGPYAAVQRAQCAATLGDWNGELAAATTALKTDGGGPRLTRIEALERAAEASLNLGRKQDALDLYNRALDLAGTRAYRAEMLFTTATLARALGDDARAVDRFRSVVVDYAEQARAAGALDALLDMERGGVVSPYQAGMARFNGKEFRAAIALFDQVEPGTADWGAAQLTRAEALVKLGRDAEAHQALQAVGELDPTHAGSALLRLGQLQERDGDEASAEVTYASVARLGPDRAAEGFFRVGFTRFVRNDTTGALAAFSAGLASGPPTPAVQATLWYWSAKSMASGSAEATEALNRAAAAAPESYYGVRAQAALGGTLRVANAGASVNDGRERAAWLATLKTTPERVAAEVNNTAALHQAEVLLQLGLRTEATWEIEGLMQQLVQARDLAHLSALADWLAQHDLPQLTLQVGRQERDVAAPDPLPTTLQRQLYPTGWVDLVQEQAARYGVDPLLMLALIRQESSFDPRAQSGAQAIGLTQVVPSTGREIATRLGREGYTSRDLLRPDVNLQFGAWFLSQLLREYNGRLFPALAAYNAGGGNVARWLDRFGDDPDVMVELVPLTETQTYLRIVYDNYWHYQALYGQ